MRFPCCNAELRFSKETDFEGLQRHPAHKPIERFGNIKGSAVLLLVGSSGDRRSFLISESILCQLGPSWENLIASRSITSFKGLLSGWISNIPKTLHLQEDCPNAMHVILLIATLQFAKVPKTLDFPEIVHLAVVAARYDAHSFLANYIDGWLGPYRESLLSPGYEEWLFIAHQFGHEMEYLRLARYLAMNCQVDESGERLLAPGTPFFLEGKFPFDTLAHIHEGRRQILYNILKATYDIWASISRGINCKVAHGGNLGIRSSCAATNLLAFTAYLRNLEIFPMLRTVTTYQASPMYLATSLSHAFDEMPIAETASESRRGSAAVDSSEHVQCHIGLQLKSIMSKILEDVGWPVEVPTLVQIKDNGEKMGKKSQRCDEEEDFLSDQLLRERRFKVVRELVSALETDPNVLNVR